VCGMVKCYVNFRVLELPWEGFSCFKGSVTSKELFRSSLGVVQRCCEGMFSGMQFVLLPRLRRNAAESDWPGIMHKVLSLGRICPGVVSQIC